MPKPTFFALPDAKRRRVTDAAVREFATQPYAAASLDRIASRARVSKGSLYQYFASKQDLYAWLLTVHVPAQKTARATPPDADLFAWLERAFIEGAAQFQRAPLLAALAARAALPSADAEARRVHGALQRLTHEGLAALLSDARARGTVRSDAPLALAADLVSSLMGTTLIAGLARTIDLTLDDVLTEPARLGEVPSSVIARHARDAAALLRAALGVAPSAPARRPRR